MSKLDDICYRMYEISGNSKYVRAEWAGKPFHPDEAKQQIKALMLELIGEDEEAEWSPRRAGHRNELRSELRREVEEL